MRDRTGIPVLSSFLIEQESKKFKRNKEEEKDETFNESTPKARSTGEKRTGFNLEEHKELVYKIKSDLARLMQNVGSENPPAKLVPGQTYSIDFLYSLFGNKYPKNYLILALSAMHNLELQTDPKTKAICGFKLKELKDIKKLKTSHAEKTETKRVSKLEAQKIGQELVQNHLGKPFSSRELPIPSANKVQTILMLCKLGYLSRVRKSRYAATFNYIVCDPSDPSFPEN